MWLVFAAASAVCFGIRGIMYHWTAQKSIDRNMLLLGVYVCGATVTLLATLYLGQEWNAAALLGMIMGFLSFVANASLIRGFAEAKASLMAMFTAMPSMVVVILAFFIWGERLNMGQLGAFVIVFLGLLLIRYSNDLTLSNLQGAQWGILTMVAFALTDITSKAATLLGAETMPTLFVMFSTGLTLFWISRLAGSRGRKKDHPAESVTDKDWPKGRTFAWGLFVGISNVFGMIFILPAFRLGITGLVTTVASMNVIIIMLYARIVVKEKFTRQEAAGMALALAGVVFLRLLE